MEGKVVAICVCATAGGQMRTVQVVQAIVGIGLEGDRYATGGGSFNKDMVGKRQVTLMNAIFFENSGFEYADSRRNLFVTGVELMWLVGREFRVGQALLRGVKYCDPCNRPSKLSGKGASFKDTFFDRGGLVAEVLEGGLIMIDDLVVPPLKGY